MGQHEDRLQILQRNYIYTSIYNLTLLMSWNNLQLFAFILYIYMKVIKSSQVCYYIGVV